MIKNQEQKEKTPPEPIVEKEEMTLSELNEILAASKATADPELKCRTVTMYGEVNEESCKLIVSSLHYYKAVGTIEEFVESEEEPESTVQIVSSCPDIDLIISTEGGSVPDMFSAYDSIREVSRSCDISTFGVGRVMSAGVLILAAGTKGKRRVGRNCRLMLHAISGGHFGSLKDLEVDIREVKWYQNQYAKALASETNLTEKKIKSIFRRKTDTYFDADQALEWGIIDEIV
jgi:ATP-dependent Clp protease protease subunit